MRTLAVIPARLESSRLSRKMLRLLAGEPLVGLTYCAVRVAPFLNDIIVATDSPEILELCRTRGWKACMTSGSHRSGTERVHEVSDQIAADVYVNVQGDEPLVRPEQIATLLGVMALPGVQVGTLKTAANVADVGSSAAVKVVTESSGRALYFSRAAIPFDRDGTSPTYFKHLGLYAYRKAALDQFVRWPESSLERSERLEQLRFLENGIPIHVAETPYDSIGVDTQDDVSRVEAILRERAKS